MMKRNRGDTTMHQQQQQQKLQEEATAKSQRRYKSPKHTHNVTTKVKTEEDLDNSPTTAAPVDVVVDSMCIASPEVNVSDNSLYVAWDELSGVWPWAVEQDVLSGWYPFVEGHFREVGEEEGVDLFDLWRLNDIVEVPN